MIFGGFEAKPGIVWMTLNWTPFHWAAGGIDTLADLHCGGRLGSGEKDEVRLYQLFEASLYCIKTFSDGLLQPDPVSSLSSVNLISTERVPPHVKFKGGVKNSLGDTLFAIQKNGVPSTDGTQVVL